MLKLTFAVVFTAKIIQMKGIPIVTLSLLVFLVSSIAQIKKGNWLAGGAGSFSHDKTTFPTGEPTSTQINLNPRIGEFFVDHHAARLYGNYTWTSSESNNIKVGYHYFGIGPFLCVIIF